MLHTRMPFKQKMTPSLSVPKQSQQVRIGAVAYLNTKPLIFGLQEILGESGVLSLELPRQLATQLGQGEIDIGLIPVIEYFKAPKYRILSDAAIACRGPVWSVRLLFRTDPALVRTIAMDVGSRTSVALTKVLFHARFGFVPETIDLDMQTKPEDARADAVLVIGDRAMQPQKNDTSFINHWDLGQVWFEETGLPFVFAMWVARDERFASSDIATSLEECREEGLKHVEQISEVASKSYPLSKEQCTDYLTNYIHFHLGPSELAGLHEFRSRCLDLRLI